MALTAERHGSGELNLLRREAIELLGALCLSAYCFDFHAPLRKLAHNWRSLL